MGRSRRAGSENINYARWAGVMYDWLKFISGGNSVARWLDGWRDVGKIIGGSGGGYVEAERSGGYCRFKNWKNFLRWYLDVLGLCEEWVYRWQRTLKKSLLGILYVWPNKLCIYFLLFGAALCFGESQLNTCQLYRTGELFYLRFFSAKYEKRIGK